MDNLRTSWHQKLSRKISRTKQSHVMLRKGFERLPMLEKMISSTTGMRTCLGFLLCIFKKFQEEENPLLKEK